MYLIHSVLIGQMQIKWCETLVFIDASVNYFDQFLKQDVSWCMIVKLRISTFTVRSIYYWRGRVAERSNALACRISLGLSSVQMPVTDKIVIVISCAPLQGCLNPVSHKVFLRCLPVYGGTTSATIRWCNGASPEMFRKKHIFLERGYKKIIYYRWCWLNPIIMDSKSNY